MSSVTVGDYLCGPGQPLLLISGPCVLQSLDLALQIAEPLAQQQRSRAHHAAGGRGKAVAHVRESSHNYCSQLFQV